MSQKYKLIFLLVTIIFLFIELSESQPSQTDFTKFLAQTKYVPINDKKVLFLKTRLLVIS